jgi:hypothetical protein
MNDVYVDLAFSGISNSAEIMISYQADCSLVEIDQTPTFHFRGKGCKYTDRYIMILIYLQRQKFYDFF